MANSLGWADTAVACDLFRKHIPMNKYFLKQQLTLLFLIGLACWALDMPFARRCSRSYLIRHPERRRRAAHAAQRPGEKFRARLTSCVSSPEGSPRTGQKKRETTFPGRRRILTGRRWYRHGAQRTRFAVR
ncbi:hypothetical protein [Klebsiella pneumoniae]|uniref:hypothetical protein n=1 Tax=Klebsiella pneumoniae TaxID=573 RepID=UPI0039873D89